jgi:hypothetical protein
MKHWLSFILLTVLLAACGGATAPTAAPTSAANPELGAIKTYLVEKASSLNTRATTLEAASQRYFDLAKASNFDYAQLWSAKAAEVSQTLLEAKPVWTEASPNYEPIEGIDAGVPTLADFDVLLDAGSSGAEGGDNIAPYDLTLADGRTLSKPGNLFGVTESTLWGTFPDYTIATVPADLNANGTQEFGEGLPEANVLLAASQKLRASTTELLAAAQAWQPNEADAFTALVTMVPTMSEYFDSWKNSRFVSGDASSQRDFVAISRLADVQDILGSLQVVYTSISPQVATLDTAQDQKITTDLAGLRAFVADIYAKEQAGQRFSAEEADMLGAEAQNRATAITGQISQVAARLNIQIAE